MTTAETATDPTASTDTVPDAVVAVYANEHDLTAAIKHLERAHFDMTSISVLGKGMEEERHVVGFDTAGRRAGRWATWGGLWGWIFGVLIFIPGVGHIAIGGYLLTILLSTGIGAAGGALGGALWSIGIPPDGVPIYEADLRADRLLLIVHGNATDVERARQLLHETSPQRLDHHQHPVDGSTQG